MRLGQRNGNSRKLEVSIADLEVGLQGSGAVSLSPCGGTTPSNILINRTWSMDAMQPCQPKSHDDCPLRLPGSDLEVKNSARASKLKDTTFHARPENAIGLDGSSMLTRTQAQTLLSHNGVLPFRLEVCIAFLFLHNMGGVQGTGIRLGRYWGWMSSRYVIG